MQTFLRYIIVMVLAVFIALVVYWLGIPLDSWKTSVVFCVLFFAMHGLVDAWLTRIFK